MNIESLVEELNMTHAQLKKVTSSEKDVLLDISMSIFEDIYILIIASEEPSDDKDYKRLYNKIRTLHDRLERARLSSTPRIQLKIIDLYTKAKDLLESGANTIFEIEGAQMSLVESKKYSEMTQQDWLKVPGIKEELYDYVKDTFDTPKKMKALMIDQERRAKALIQDLVELQGMDILIGLGDVERRQKRELFPGRIILMDGHGRMIWQLLHEWHNVMKKESPLDIVLVEFNKENFHFHKINLPLNIEHIYGDIFDDQAYDLNHTSDVVYYNFTSIGKQAPTLFRRLAQHAMLGVRTHWSFMRQFSKPKSPPPALFSHAFWHINKVNWYYGMLEGADSVVAYAVAQVSKRNAFYTMKLDFSEFVTVFDFKFAGLPKILQRYELDVGEWSRLLEHLFSVDLYTLKISNTKLSVGQKYGKDQRLKKMFDSKEEKNEFVTQMLNLVDNLVIEYAEYSESDTSDIQSFTYMQAMALRAQQFLKEGLKLKKSTLDEVFKKLRF